MNPPLVADSLVEEAMKATGLSRFDSESWREGLEIFLADQNKIEIGEDFHARLRAHLVMNLSNRLKSTDYLDKRPELLARPIERPLFVFGLPRTGTTLLNNLLASDPARRSPLVWEIDDPVPPPTSATLYTDPRAVARLEQEAAMKAAYPEAFKYYRSSAIYPNECIFMMEHDFKAFSLESHGKLPNYRDWLLSTDMTSAYAYEKRYLQLLQADAPGIWNLKMPSHAMWLDTIRKVFPDARFVWTHRDPLTALGSFCSLISVAHRGFQGFEEREWITEDCVLQATEIMNRIMDYRERQGQDSMVDLHYAELMADPIATMRKLYAALGDDFTPEAEAGMQAWLDDNPQGKFGRHEYKLEQYGLTAAGAAKLFERYTDAIDIAEEGKA